MSGAPRVLWLHQNFVAAGEGGNPRSAYVLDGLLAHGWAVDLVVPQESYLGARRADASPEVVVERRGGLTVHRLPVGWRGPSGLRRRGRSYAAFAWQALRYLRRLPRAEVVFCSSPPLPQLTVAAAAALRMRARLVLEVRDLWPAFLEEAGMIRSGTLLAGLRWLEAFGYRAASRVVVTSPAFVPYLRRMGVDGDRITTALTGADASFSRAEPGAGAAWRREMGLEDAFVVAYTGSLNESYGVAGLVEAARLTTSADPRIVWVFAGDGRGRPEVESAAAESGAIRYLGLLPRDQIVPVLLGADVGVHSHVGLPLLETTITGKVFDYLAAGLPVVARGGGITGELVRAAGAGEAVGAPAAELAAAVLRFAAMDDARRTELGARGQAWVERHAPTALCGQRVAEAVRASIADAPVGWASLTRAKVGGARDVLARRSRRALDELFGADRERTVQDAFGRWLDEAELRDGSLLSTSAADPSDA